MILIASTYRCPNPKCREACERVGEAIDLWQHKADGSTACGLPQRFEVAPHKAGWSGRLWRIDEARQAMRQAAQVKAAALGVDTAQRLAIAGAIEQAWEAGLAFGQDEYLRPHPVTRFAQSART